jgi:putative aldouronate transport system permease protein
MVLPVIAYYVIFHYGPMYGVIIAFKDYAVTEGILASDWVGLKHFYAFFESYYAWRLIRNTILINVLALVWAFPAPIILALLLNEVRNRTFKKLVQTFTYMPHFISLVVIVSIITLFSRSDGLFNDVVALFGGRRTNLLMRPELFRTIFISSGIWQNVGFGSIIYLAALSNIDPELYQAAQIDGAGRLRQTFHITLPGIAPTIIILLILRLGNMLTVGFEKIILLYNPMTYETADVIASFIYRKGLVYADYSYGAAVGLLNAVVNFMLLVTANSISRRVSETSLW